MSLYLSKPVLASVVCLVFSSTFSVSSLVLLSTPVLPGFGRGDINAILRVFWEEDSIRVISLAISLPISMFALWIARSPHHWRVMFHIFYFIGLGLLAWCLWGVLALSPITGSHLLLTDWSTRILLAAFLGPLVWLLIIPIGCLLLSFAILIDYTQNAQPGDGGNRQTSCRFTPAPVGDPDAQDVAPSIRRFPHRQRSAKGWTP